MHIDKTYTDDNSVVGLNRNNIVTFTNNPENTEHF